MKWQVPPLMVDEWYDRHYLDGRLDTASHGSYRLGREGKQWFAQFEGRPLPLVDCANAQTAVDACRMHYSTMDAINSGDITPVVPPQRLYVLIMRGDVDPLIEIDIEGPYWDEDARICGASEVPGEDSVYRLNVCDVATVGTFSDDELAPFEIPNNGTLGLLNWERRRVSRDDCDSDRCDICHGPLGSGDHKDRCYVAMKPSGSAVYVCVPCAQRGEDATMTVRDSRRPGVDPIGDDKAAVD